MPTPLLAASHRLWGRNGIQVSIKIQNIGAEAHPPQAILLKINLAKRACKCSRLSPAFACFFHPTIPEPMERLLVV